MTSPIDNTIKEKLKKMTNELRMSIKKVNKKILLHEIKEAVASARKIN